jgi:arylsulfatase A-like enzyme
MQLKLAGLILGITGLLFPSGLSAAVQPGNLPTGDSVRPPNIIVIMADDIGYGDLSCYGATAIETPRLDRLATGGLRFVNGYCSASTCTPTRYSFLTGNYAFRTPGTGVAPPNGPAIIQPGTPTLASLLRQAGYRTGVIGKWHLGLGPRELAHPDLGRPGPDWNGELKPGPLEIGFDSCFLLPTTNDRVPQVYVQDHHVLNLDPNDPLWVGNEKPSDDHPTGVSHRQTLKMDWSHGHNQTIHNGISRIGFYTGGQTARFRDEDLADKWIEKSCEFIESNRERPFFLFFASHDNHVPRIPHERFQGKSGLGFRGDAILQLDWCVGALLDQLERLQLTEQTLIIFCSDNGPVMDDGYVDGALEQRGDHQAAGPFSGGKYSVYEGGTRTPFITYWQGTISPGVSTEMVCTIDLAHSLAALAGEVLPADACLDSLNVLGALLGKPGGAGRQHLVQQNNQGTHLGLRVLENGRDWKLISAPNGQMYNLKLNQPLGNTEIPQIQLFDLQADPAEKKDLREQHPEVVDRLLQLLNEIKTGKGSRFRESGQHID